MRIENSPPTQPRSGRRQRKAEATRAALIDAALSAFERQPIGLVSVLDITEAADVAKGVFYLHFKSKDEFLLTLWSRIHAEMLETMSQDGMNKASSAQRLETVIECYYDQAAPDARRARFCLRMSSFLPDEIDAPGSMCKMLSSYLRELGTLLERKDDVDAFQTAALLDAMCWARLWQPMRLNLGLPSRALFTDQIQRVMS